MEEYVQIFYKINITDMHIDENILKLKKESKIVAFRERVCYNQDATACTTNAAVKGEGEESPPVVTRFHN